MVWKRAVTETVFPESVNRTSRYMKTALISLLAVNSVILCLALWKALTSGGNDLVLTEPKEKEEVAIVPAQKPLKVVVPTELPKVDIPATDIPTKVMAPENKQVVDELVAETNNVTPPESTLQNKDDLEVVERAVPVHAPEVQPVEPKIVEEPEVAEEQHCWMLGAFSSEALAQKVEAKLLPKSELIKVIDHSTSVVKNYWVHLPRFSSRKAAFARNQELKRQKIDSFLVTKGERANAISLGIFSTEARAKRLQAILRKKGVDAKIKPNMTINPQYWLEVHGIPKGEWPKLQPLVTPVIKAAQKKAQKMIQKPCKAVASFS